MGWKSTRLGEEETRQILYKDLAIERQRVWQGKAKVELVLVGALGVVRNDLQQRLD